MASTTSAGLTSSVLAQHRDFQATGRSANPSPGQEAVGTFIERIEDWLGKSVVGQDGEKIGKLEDIIFAADSTPLFGAVSTGLFGRRTSLVPLEQASLAPDRIAVPFLKDAVKDAPQIAGVEDMTSALEDQASEYYRLPARARDANEGYSSAEERLKLAKEADQARGTADSLEQQASELAEEIQSAEKSIEAAKQRRDELKSQHADVIAQAQQARERQTALEQQL